MKLARIPTGVTGFVATVAVRNRHATERLVGNVIGCRSIGRWKAPGVAGRTLVGDGRLSVVPAGGFPSGGGMTTGAIQTGGNMGGGLAGRGAAVVATGTVGGADESGMVHTGRGQPARRLVAGAARGRCLNVTGRFANRCGSVVATPAGIGGNPCMVKLGADKRRRGVAAVTAQLGLKVG